MVARLSGRRKILHILRCPLRTSTISLSACKTCKHHQGKRGDYVYCNYGPPKVRTIRTRKELMKLPTKTTQIRITSYIGASTVKDLRRFRKLKTIIASPKTKITKEAINALRKRGLTLIFEKG